MRKKFLLVALIISVSLCITNVEASTLTKYNYETEENINSTEKTINVGTLYYATPTSTYDFFDENGNFNNVYINDEHVFWSKYNKDLKMVNKVTLDMFYDKSNSSDFDKPLISNFRNAIYYNEHLYVMYGRENAYTNPADVASKYCTMALVKYNKQGNIVDTLEMQAAYLNNYTSWQAGTYLPFFPNSNCSLAVNSKGILGCFYGKTMFDSHQASNVMFIDISGDTMVWVSNRFRNTEENKEMYDEATQYYNSHSMGTRIIATSDDNFLFADSGDAAKRGLTIGKIFKNEEINKMQLRLFRAIHYRESASSNWEYNNTYSVPGNVIEVSDGYLYIGSLEKTLSLDYGKSINEPWNLLVQKYKKDFEKYTDVPSVCMLNTSTRIAEGQKPELSVGRLYLTGEEKDYGIKWLTDLKDKLIIQVKPVKIDNDNIVIIWEELSYSMSSYINAYSLDNNCRDMYYMIIDKDGNIIVDRTKISNVKLSLEEEFAYKDGKIYWTTAEGTKKITVNVLDFNNNPVTDISINCGSEVTISKGRTKKVNLVVNPSNTSDSVEVTWTSKNTSVATVDSNGLITAKEDGTTVITCTVKAINNEEIKTFTKDITVTVNSISTDKKIGDLDGDGSVNADDAAVALDLYKYRNATAEDLLVGDIDGDGFINADDAALILDIYKYGL